VGLFCGIWLALLGVLGAATLIVSKRPDAKTTIDKLRPYQGWIGAISAIWGAWGIVSALTSLTWLSHYPIYWLTFTACAVLQLALGILIGVGIFKTFVKNPVANRKMDATVAKLSPYQSRFGIAGIALGAWMVAASIVWRVG
jgi:hypothetical protein